MCPLDLETIRVQMVTVCDQAGRQKAECTATNRSKASSHELKVQREICKQSDPFANDSDASGVARCCQCSVPGGAIAPQNVWFRVSCGRIRTQGLFSVALLVSHAPEHRANTIWGRRCDRSIPVPALDAAHGDYWVWLSA